MTSKPLLALLESKPIQISSTITATLCRRFYLVYEVHIWTTAFQIIRHNSSSRHDWKAFPELGMLVIVRSRQKKWRSDSTFWRSSIWKRRRGRCRGNEACWTMMEGHAMASTALTSDQDPAYPICICICGVTSPNLFFSLFIFFIFFFILSVDVWSYSAEAIPNRLKLNKEE